MTPDCCDDCAIDFSEFLVRRRNSSNCHSGHSKRSASIGKIQKGFSLNY